jgi:ABC-type polysaccharide/polyol phosphate transport system ATPase subunit
MQRVSQSLDGIDLNIHRGEIFAFRAHNGAGQAPYQYYPAASSMIPRLGGSSSVSHDIVPVIIGRHGDNLVRVPQELTSGNMFGNIGDAEAPVANYW